MLLCVLKTTDEVWDPYRLVILIQNSLFCMRKPQMRVGTNGDSNSDANNAVLHAQNDWLGLGHIDTCNSALKFTVLHAKTTDEGRDP